MCYLVGILIGIPIGLFLSVFFYAWLDEREDPFAGINIPQTETTCINWELRKAAMEKDKESIPLRRRPGGHLGRIDHKARERFSLWIKEIE